MKKFSFSLQKLLDYKEQIFDSERMVLSDMNAALSRMNAELIALIRERKERSARYNECVAEGMTPAEMQTHKNYLRTLDDAIKQKTAQIELQQKAIEKQTDKVREAKMEISTIEKLREKKLDEYNYSENKANEIFIDEFVSNTKATSLEI